MSAALPSTFPSLAPSFAPPFGRFGETIGPPCPAARPVADLLAPTRTGNPAALSMWSQHYCLSLIPCTVAASLLGRDLPVAFDTTGAVLDEAGQPCRLCLPHAGGAAAERCPVRRLAPLLREHLQPLADALARAGLPPLVTWANAAAILSWSLRVIDTSPADREAIGAAMAVPRWADGGANPFRDAIGDDPGRRRVCCLRFRLPSIARCPDCPVACRRPATTDEDSR